MRQADAQVRDVPASPALGHRIGVPVGDQVRQVPALSTPPREQWVISGRSARRHRVDVPHQPRIVRGKAETRIDLHPPEPQPVERAPQLVAARVGAGSMVANGITAAQLSGRAPVRASSSCCRRGCPGRPPVPDRRQVHRQHHEPGVAADSAGAHWRGCTSRWLSRLGFLLEPIQPVQLFGASVVLADQAGASRRPSSGSGTASFLNGRSQRVG